MQEIQGASAVADVDVVAVRDFGTALLIGALVGMERERRNQRDQTDVLGLRTFMLLAVAGAAAASLARTLGSPLLLGAGLLIAIAPVIAGYLAQARISQKWLGVTTEVAAVVVCLLSAMAVLGHRELAVLLAVVTTAALAYKQPLHGIVHKLGSDDLYAGVRLLLATFVVWPLLPDRTVDPWGALNPHDLWLLVLLMSGLSLLGYVATRWLGPGRGVPVTATAGGVVSSTAVTLTFVRQSREADADHGALAGGIALAWSIMFVRVVVAATIVCPPLFGPLLPPFLTLAVVSGGAAALLLWPRRGQPAARADVPLRNPFSLTAAIKFALLFAVVQVVLAVVQQHAPASGVYAVAAVAGLTDVDAVTLSMAGQARAGGDVMTVAVGAIAVAALANTLVKCGMAVALGSRALGRRIAVVTAVLLVAGGIAAIVA